MCFRPAGAQPSVICPECGEMVFAAVGVFPNNCPYCDADIRAEVEAVKSGGGDAVSTAATISAPTAPVAPAATSKPGAPKPPVQAPPRPQ